MFLEEIDIKIYLRYELTVGENQQSKVQLNIRWKNFDDLAFPIQIEGVKQIVQYRDFDDRYMRDGGIRSNYELKFSILDGIKRFTVRRGGVIDLHKLTV